MRARVEIHLKKGVTDPEGDNVLKALKLLGFGSVTGVRSIKVFEIDTAEKSQSRSSTQSASVRASTSCVAARIPILRPREMFVPGSDAAAG